MGPMDIDSDLDSEQVTPYKSSKVVGDNAVDLWTEAFNQLINTQSNVELLDLSILRLKFRRNSTLPIAAIPSEIMEQIFLMLSNDFIRLDFYYVLQMDTEQNSWDWLEITKVCRYWRNLALDCAVLWTNIRPTFTVSKVQAFLERSKQADLAINIGGLKDGRIVQFDVAVLQMMYPHMNRVRDITILTDRDNSAWLLIQQLLDNSNSQLRLLNLIASNQESDEHPSIRIENSAVLSSLSDLSILALDGICVPWNKLYASNLSTLVLKHIEQDTYKPTISELLRILAAAPNLQSVFLNGIGPRHPIVENLSLTLPLLRSFEFWDVDYGICTILLENLIIPKDTYWNISCNNYPIDQSQQFLPHFLNSKEPCRRVRIIFDDVSINVFLWNKDEQVTPTFGFDYDSLFGLEHRTNTLFKCMRSVFRHAYFKDVTILDLDLTWDMRARIVMMPRASWLHLFSAFPKTEKLSVTFPCEEERKFEMAFVESLTMFNTRTSELFPNLLEMEISGAMFSTRNGRTAYKMLIQHLQHRRIHGRQLKSLLLSQCDGVDEAEILNLANMNIAEKITS